MKANYKKYSVDINLADIEALFGRFVIANPVISVTGAVIIALTSIWMMGVAIEQFMSIYAWGASIVVSYGLIKTKNANVKMILISSLLLGSLFYLSGFVSYASQLPSIPILGTIIKGLYTLTSLLVMPFAVIPLFVVHVVQISLVLFVMNIYFQQTTKKK